MLRDECGAGVFAQDAGGGGECVGDVAAVCDDGDGSACGEAETCARVHDVAEALAVDVDELFGVARGGDGGVGEEEDEGRRAWLLAVGGDAPACLARGRVADDDVSGESDAGGGEASGAEEVEGGLRGEAFADAAEIEACAGAGEGGGLVGVVEDEGGGADGGEGLVDVGLRWEGGGPACLAPEGDGAADGDVEGAGGVGGELFGE